MAEIERYLGRDYDRGRDLTPYLDSVARIGGVIVSDFLDKDLVDELKPFCASLNPQEVKETDELVPRRLSYLTEFSEAQTNAVNLIGRLVSDRLRRYGNKFKVLETWQPNEFTVQQYEMDSFISKHKDTPDNVGVVVLLSLQGVSHFELSDRLDGPPIAAWRVKAGDAVILGAKGFPGKGESIYHSVGGAATDEPRVSVRIAQNPKLKEDFSAIPKLIR